MNKDEMLKEKIETALLTHHDVPDVKVIIEKGEVILKGQVQDQSEARSVVTEVLMIPGVVSVSEELDYRENREEYVSEVAGMNSSDSTHALNEGRA